MVKISETNHVLLAVGDQARRTAMASALADDGHEVSQAATGAEALSLLETHVFQLVITDLSLNGTHGVDIVKIVQEQSPVTPVIITADHGSAAAGLEAMRHGAFDFRELPLDHDHLRLAVNRALEKASLHHAFYYLRHEQPYLYRLESIVARSPRMREVLQQVANLAPSDSTVLITGETGVGKNLIAGAIHANSPRREATIVTVSCAALAESLLESELFGHEKGAFTGAVQPRTGRFQQAHGGTLFLDEVGEMSPTIQAKVLRAIDDQLIYRLGGSREIHVNVRILAATNRDLREEVERGGFRKDLFYRLNVAPLHIPPLRERPEDIMPLVERFGAMVCRRLGRPPMEFSPEAVSMLEGYSWPGNVRELRNVVERTALFVRDDEVRAMDLNLKNGTGDTSAGAFPGQAAGMFVAHTLNLEALERQAILTALEMCDWVQSEAADHLGLTPSAMSYKLNRLGIKHPKFRSRKRRR